MRIAFAIFLSTVVGVFGFQAKGPGKRYTLDLHEPTGSIKPTSEMRLKVTITNNSKNNVIFVRSPGLVPEEEANYRIDIRDASGHEPLPTDFSRQLKEKDTYGGSHIRYVLSAGKSMEDELVLSRLYVMKAGEYKVSVARGIRPSWQDSKQEAVQSNWIKLKVDD